ncbi:MAG: NAD(P)-dependent alcohol dehydrogenase [Candidatus Nanopelagicaceae bacterium]|nr:NAD(P)-dependent alcohol dehydrogenase [Candidatus Nanopelagicaceae bacterium]
MRAIVHNTYGSPDALEFQEIEKPEMTDDGVMVCVRAASINPVDLYMLMGTPLLVRMSNGVRRPKNNRLGIDFAGTVEAVGKDVTEFRVGDEVFGGENGALAEYVCVRDGFVSKPANLTFEEAATVPVAAITALQGLRDKGQIQPGQKVLINGASGGVGTFAVQIAKALGAEVTAVCSTRNVELVRSLGADHVIDYTREDYTRSDRRYDLILDLAGSKSWSESRRILNPQATLVIVGAPKGNALLGPLGHIVKVRLAALRSSQKVVFFMAKINQADMMVLRELLESGKVKSVIDRNYLSNQMSDAFRYLGEGHAQGKIVLTL